LKIYKKITNALTSSFNFSKDVVFSIETTPVIAAREPEKIEAVYKMGYKRISMGIQTISEKLLNELGREGTTHIYEKAVKNIRKAGFSMFNIDLMYGFLHQSEDDFENTIRYAIGLKPEYITLYRNRYKGTKLEQEAGGVSLYKIISQYRLAYNLLTENGYSANVGKIHLAESIMIMEPVII
jgi:oxygen-independent coproporphyrinogen-3 oxidase